MTATASYSHNWACLSIEGKDSRTFLQGQLSNDLDLISEQLSGFFALCTPKGRTVANFFIVQQPGTEPNNLLLLMPESTAQSVLDTLSKYIVFSKADLALSTEWRVDFVRLDQNFPFEKLKLTIPEASAMSTSQNRECSLVRMLNSSDGELGLLIRSAETEIGDLATIQLTDNEVELALIHAGIGLVREQTSDEFVPQMLNMQLNNGISFTKGCYTGQEIVARAQYRGKIKRRMYRASGHLEQLPTIGKDVNDLDSGKSLGLVVAAAQAANGQVELLAVLNLKEDVEHKLAIDDVQLNLLSLPYDDEQANT